MSIVIEQRENNVEQLIPINDELPYDQEENNNSLIINKSDVIKPQENMDIEFAQEEEEQKE